MSNDETPTPIYDPANMPASSLLSRRAVWYKRPWVMALVAILVVVGASILVDVPGSVNNAQDTVAQDATIKQINSDLGGCDYAIQETFGVYKDLEAGQLTSFDKGYAPKMLTDDQTACSFTSNLIFDLTNNIQVSDTKAGIYVDRMLSASTIWTTSDALAAVEDIQVLYNHPNNAAKLADLAKQERLLNNDRNQAFADIASADLILHAHLWVPNIPVLPHV